MQCAFVKSVAVCCVVCQVGLGWAGSCRVASCCVGLCCVLFCVVLCCVASWVYRQVCIRSTPTYRCIRYPIILIIIQCHISSCHSIPSHMAVPFFRRILDAHCWVRMAQA